MTQLPIKTKIEDVDVTRVFGQSLFGMFPQIARIMERHRYGKQLKDFFAEPTISKVDKVIYWRTQVSGSVRSWHDLSRDEQLSVSNQIGSNYQYVQDLCEELTKVQGANAPSVEALKCMLVTPGIESSTFVVGNQIVLTQWGCRPNGRIASDFDLKVQGLKAVTYLKPDTSNVTQVPHPEDSQPDPQAQEQTVTSKPDTPSKTQLIPPAEVSKIDVAPEESLIEDADKKEPLPPQKLYWRWLLLLLLLIALLLGLWFKKWTYVASYDIMVEERYRSDIANLWLQIDEKSKTCKPIIQEKMEPFPLTPDALDRKDLNVFNGNWLLITELLNAKTDEKIQIQFSFDSSGQGSTSTQEIDGNICSGTALVAIDSARSFTVNMSQQSCKNGGKYRENKAECTVRSDNKTADCVLQCVDGKCDARFDRR